MTPEKIKYQGALYVLAEEKTEKKKRMVIMVGGPASGKGFFLGEPEKWTKKDFKKGKCKEEDIGKRKPNTGYGSGLPKNLEGLIEKHEVSTDKEEDKNVDYDESDRHLRFIQNAAAQEHFAVLQAAKKKGPEDFKKALEDHWYNTKDGKKRSLVKSGPKTYKKDKEGKDLEDENGDKVVDSFHDVTADNLPDSFDDFYEMAKPFYESMRAWHDESGTIDKDGKFHPKMNKKTGKIAEPFKDRARDSFDEAIKARLADTSKDNTVIVDSAGEDLDVQDFPGQIEAAKRAGYEVSIVFLDMDQEDAELSNMQRGFINKKRMVDQQDIDNFWKVKDEQIEKLKKLMPDRFVHLKREPPLTKEEREKIKKSMQYVNGKPTVLVDPDSPIKTIDDVKAAGGDPKEIDGIVGGLYKPAYKARRKTSKGIEKLKEKKLSPNEHHEEFGECPDGYHWDKEKKTCYEVKEEDKKKKAAQLARRIAAAAYEIRHNRNLERRAMSDMEEKLVKQAAEFIKKGLPAKIRGYPVSVFTKKGAIDVFVRIKDGAGDISALKQLRSSLDDAAKKMDAGMGRGWQHKIVSSNVGDDMIVTVELHAP